MGRGGGGGGRSTIGAGTGTGAGTGSNKNKAGKDSTKQKTVNPSASPNVQATRSSPFSNVRERSATQEGFNSVVKQALDKKDGRVSLASLRRLTGLPRDKFDKFIKSATEKGVGFLQSGQGVNIQKAAAKVSPNEKQNAIAVARRKNARLFEGALDGDGRIYFSRDS